MKKSALLLAVLGLSSGLMGAKGVQNSSRSGEAGRSDRSHYAQQLAAYGYGIGQKAQYGMLMMSPDEVKPFVHDGFKKTLWNPDELGQPEFFEELYKTFIDSYQQRMQQLLSADPQKLRSGDLELLRFTPFQSKGFGAYVALLQTPDMLHFSKEEAGHVAQGMEDYLLGRDVSKKMDNDQMAAFIAARAEIKNEETHAMSTHEVEGDKEMSFEEKLEKDPNVKKDPSGLMYTIEREGEGEFPKMSDAVLMHYHGMLPDGTVFDSSMDRGTPIVLPLSGVIKGFSLGLQKIKAPRAQGTSPVKAMQGKGGKVTLYIPSELGYGKTPPPGSKIPPNSMLVFKCELLHIIQ